MDITNIRIRKLYDEDRLKALVSVTLGQELAIHDIKVIQGPDRLFIAMPSRKDENGLYRDIVHPINKNIRQQLEEAVLEVYQNEIQNYQKIQAINFFFSHRMCGKGGI